VGCVVAAAKADVGVRPDGRRAVRDFGLSQARRHLRSAHYS